MTILDPVEPHPLPVAVLRGYLLSRSGVTGLAGSRVGSEMPPAAAAPRFPALRLTEISSTQDRHLTRTLFQIDCWAATQAAADRLARVVAAELRAVRQHVTSDAVLAGVSDLSARPLPDTSLTPTQPRAIVTGHLWIHPHTEETPP